MDEALECKNKREKCLKRIKGCAANEEHMKSERRRLAGFCHVRLLKPQRLLNLSPFEEEARCEYTWRAFDQALWRIHLEA